MFTIGSHSKGQSPREDDVGTGFLAAPIFQQLVEELGDPSDDEESESDQPAEEQENDD